MGCFFSSSHSKSPSRRNLERSKKGNGDVKRNSRGSGPINHKKLITSSHKQLRSGHKISSTSTVNAKASGAALVAKGARGGEFETEKNQVGNISKRFVEKKIGRDEFVDGWPKWLVDNIPTNVLAGLIPKSADSYEKLAKVGRGTYSNVYKARDKESGKIVALKKVRFDTSDSESIKFMAREITILQTLDHPNIIKLEGIATSRMQYSLYLVFDFMQADLARIISRPGERLTEPQIKCYMQQLLAGLQHCYERGVMHRDIKPSNLLIDKQGVLKIGDFGLANSLVKPKGPLTNRVVTLWYRAPELLLGSTDYGFGIDLWSAGCLLAEMFTGRPIMPGRTEVEQLHMIFKLCGSPSEDYWKKLKLMTSYRPPQRYKPNYEETFPDFPSSSLGLLTKLLALDPTHRGSAASALKSEEKSMEPNMLSKEMSTSVSSTSSGSKLYMNEGNIKASLSPVVVSGPRTEAHPNALKNIKNYALLQPCIIDMINRKEGNGFVQARRSFSASDFHLDPEKLSNFYGMDKKVVHRI
ncbi:hypothetical protein L6164_012306 [Bauhinia variegata]|uniref:Uncharacterized protein n=1 Tax=Bauhinia variegata TaxID=167791 RepID=A0ACB9PB41_BAUVA|nr:hypothetical protein L6164_012306 [Bauhinia variegata]